jgi:hypothetical protein
MKAALAQSVERLPCKQEVAGSNPSGQHHILTAHQPVLMPWAGFFHKMALADSFVIFDGVQFERHGYSNRVRIKTHKRPKWLTIPVEHGQPRLCDARIVPGNWARKHLKSIEFAYSKAPHFERYWEELEAVYSLAADCSTLSDCTRTLMIWLMEKLGIRKRVINATTLGLDGSKSELVLDMCLKMQATTYIFGSQGLHYADAAAFQAAGVRAVFQAYQHPEYPQLHGPFVPGLSVLDLLMNCGPESLDIIMRGNVSRETLEAA